MNYMSRLSGILLALSLACPAIGSNDKGKEDVEAVLPNLAPKHVLSLSVDGAFCPGQQGQFRVGDARYRIQLVNHGQDHATLDFSTTGADDISTSLESDLTPLSMIWVPQGAQKYDPSQKLEDYKRRLNEMHLPGARKYNWNQSGAARLGESKLLLELEARAFLRFYDTVIKQDHSRHKTEIFFTFGLEGDSGRGEALVYEFEHTKMERLEDGIWHLNSHKRLKAVYSVIYDTLPESIRKRWVEAADFKADPKYAELDLKYFSGHADPEIANYLNVEIPEEGIFFRNRDGEPLKSNYIFSCSFDSRYLMTTLKSLVSLILSPINKGGDGFVFADTSELTPELYILEATTFPLSLHEGASVTPAFGYGYFKLVSSLWDGNFIKQIFSKYNSYREELVEYQSRNVPAFSEADLTNSLSVQAPEIDLPKLVRCIMYMNMSVHGQLIPRVKVAFSDMKKSFLADHLVPLIEASQASERSLNHVDLRPVLFTNPTLLRHYVVFPQLVISANDLEFDKQVVSNAILKWLWSSRFQYRTVGDVNAREVSIDCRDGKYQALRQMYELRSLMPVKLTLTVDQMPKDELMRLIDLIRGNPRLEEVCLETPAVLDSRLFQVIADTASIKRFYLKPQGPLMRQTGLSDLQFQKYVQKARYEQGFLLTIDTTTDSNGHRKTADSLVAYLNNNADNIQSLEWNEGLCGGMRFKESAGQIINAIGKMTNLTTVDGSGSELGTADVVKLLNTLKKVPSVRTVGVYLYNWNDDIKPTLATLSQLTEVILKCHSYSYWHRDKLLAFWKEKNRGKDLNVTLK